jgi:hypothetical protein
MGKNARVDADSWMVGPSTTLTKNKKTQHRVNAHSPAIAAMRVPKPLMLAAASDASTRAAATRYL